MIFELSLAISAPVIFAAAWHSARKTADYSAAVRIEIGEPARDRTGTAGTAEDRMRSPELVSRAFRGPPAAVEKPGSTVPSPKKEPLENKLISLGTIRDAGNIERLYLKHIDTDAIRAIRTDGNVEGGNYIASVLEGLYVINLEGVLYSLRRE
jgi:hypothetical protein